MTVISRRKFIQRSVLALPGLSLLRSGSPDRIISSGQDFKIFIPMPLQIVIDDVGWRSGTDGSKWQEPYRTGISRDHVPADYQAIADLGKALGVRPQAATVLCEWDKENILRELPTSTWMGEKWDNRKNIGPWMDEAAEIIRNNRDHYELTIHGIGHEYWENGTFTRAEWTDSAGRMRPADQVQKHLEYFGRLLEQHNLGPMPESFVPCAFRHCFGISEGSDVSLASILARSGINYINTPFRIMYNRSAVSGQLFGIDSPVMTIDRGEDEFEWLVFPARPNKFHSGPTYGLHWPNMLHPDPAHNGEVVANWADYFRQYNEMPGMVLAADSKDMQGQLGHNRFTKFTVNKGIVEFDFTGTDKLPREMGKKEFTVKVVSEVPLRFKPAGLRISSQSLVRNTDFLYSLKIGRISNRGKGIIRISVN